MFKDAFIKPDLLQTEKLVRTINPFLDTPMDSTTTSIMVHDLAFYPGHFLAELNRHDAHPQKTRSVIANSKGDVFVLNGSNDVIYRLNKTTPILLDDNNIIEYIRFFFCYVRGKHGRFLIVENVDDLNWREEPSVAGRKALAKMINPVTLKAKDTDGTYTFAANIIFKDSLFLSDIRVSKNGMVQMLNEELLVEEIPVADDLFGQ
jgi:hypothetical protein